MFKCYDSCKGLCFDCLEEEEDYHIFNGVYYDDAMEMEAAIEEHLKWYKKRKEFANEAAKETLIDEISKEDKTV